MKLNRNTLTNIAFVVPSVVFYTVLIIGPLVLSVYYSLYNWDGISKHMSFIGMRNYVDGLHDVNFKNTIFVTFFFTIVGGILGNILGLFFAVLLNNRGKMTNFYRSIFFFPMLLSSVVIGFIWQTILSYSGVFNQVVEKLGLEPVEFLGRQWPAMLSLQGIMLWAGVGFAIVFYLAGLQTVSKDYYDAAKIDGASSWAMFRNVTYPLIAPALTLNVVFSIMGGLKQYDLVAVVTGGGPAKMTETMAYSMIREAFTNNHFSYGSALGIYLLLIIAVLTIVTTVFLRRREEHIVD